MVSFRLTFYSTNNFFQIIYIICERLLKLAKKPKLLHIPSGASLSVELETSPNALQIRSSYKGAAVAPDTSLEDPVLNPSLSKPQAHNYTNGVHGQGRHCYIFSLLYFLISIYW